MVYFELGRYPLHIKRKILMLKYWLNLLSTSNCILKACYDNLLQLHYRKPNCKDNWIDHVKYELCSSGFGNVWYDQHVINVRNFTELFTQRLHDKFKLF